MKIHTALAVIGFCLIGTAGCMAACDAEPPAPTTCQGATFGFGDQHDLIAPAALAKPTPPPARRTPAPLRKAPTTPVWKQPPYRPTFPAPVHSSPHKSTHGGHGHGGSNHVDIDLDDC